jgi:hypothetical protein
MLLFIMIHCGQRVSVNNTPNNKQPTKNNTQNNNKTASVKTTNKVITNNQKSPVKPIQKISTDSLTIDRSEDNKDKTDQDNLRAELITKMLDATQEIYDTVSIYLKKDIENRDKLTLVFEDFNRKTNFVKNTKTFSENDVHDVRKHFDEFHNNLKLLLMEISDQKPTTIKTSPGVSILNDRINNLEQTVSNLIVNNNSKPLSSDEKTEINVISTSMVQNKLQDLELKIKYLQESMKEILENQKEAKIEIDAIRAEIRLSTKESNNIDLKHIIDRLKFLENFQNNLALSINHINDDLITELRHGIKNIIHLLQNKGEESSGERNI